MELYEYCTLGIFLKRSGRIEEDNGSECDKWKVKERTERSLRAGGRERERESGERGREREKKGMSHRNGQRTDENGRKCVMSENDYS